MTDAISSFGTLLKAGDGGDPETFATIAEVLDISGPEETLETEEATNHGSPSATAEFIATVIMPGEVTFDVNYIPGNATQLALRTDLQNRTLRNFQLVLPDSGNETSSFAAFVTKVGKAEPVKGKLTGSFTLLISGPVTTA